MKKSQALTALKLTLKPEHQKLIEAKLDTGCYANPDEVIAEALQLLSKREEEGMIYLELSDGRIIGFPSERL
jgi:antitoxin ParD1/3/4